MDWKTFDSVLSGPILWASGYAKGATGEIFIVAADLTIRRNDGTQGRYADETLLGGPFESLDAAKAAYLVMVS